MANDKKSIPDAGKVDEPPKLGKVEPAKAAPPVQEQPTPAKTEAPVVEDVPKVVAPPAAEAPKDKGTSAPSKEGTPQPGKDEKQTTIPGMGDPAPAGKVVDFTAAREGAAKGKPPEKAAAPDKDKQADKTKDAAKPRRGRPPKADKAAPDEAKPQPRDKMSQSKPPAEKGAPATAEAPAATEQPPAPRDAARGVKEEIVYLNLSELHPFKNHPFGVRDDAEMQGLVESVKAAGVNQPALVRPREGGGYEIIAGHRRQRASELAGFVNMPCIVRNMTDDEAILAMTDDNLRHRERILPTEKAAALKQQVEAIKHQGARPGEDDRDAGKRSTQIVGDRNGMNYKQVQRYIRLTELVPDLQKMVDEKQLSFTPAVEISFIRPKHQKYIAVAIEGQASSPSLSQAQKMRELDKEGKLNGDVIDGSCNNHNSGLRKCSSTHYIRLDFLEQVVLYEVHRLACFANEYENDFIKAMVGRSAKVAENDRVRKKRELDGLLARDRELDMLFERLYEDNVSGKIDDARFAKMSKRYEQEQGENAGRIKALRLELKKLEDKRMDVDAFLETVRRYTDATTITKRMVAELIQYIEVYPAVKEDGITNQRVTIHYNCIGAFEVPDRRKIPERDILLETRKGVALSYAPAQIAI